MYRRVFAFDYDGTLADNGRIPSSLLDKLKQLHLAGFALFLVTGRQYETIDVSHLTSIFSGIVWENGAVLQHIAADELYLPFGQLERYLLDALEEEQIPLEKGLAIASTWKAHEEAVWRILSKTGSDAAIIHNKGAVMILPSGTTKGTGLERLLELCGYSPRNLISFGDGENDISLFQISEVGIAVQDAVPSLKTAADHVTQEPGSEGVEAALAYYWLANNAPPQTAVENARFIKLGKNEQDQEITISGATLANQNLGVFGDSGSGKSWVTGLLAEGMHVAGYQVLMIDPEGDFRGLGSLPGVIALSGDGNSIPAPSVITTILDEASISIVLDMCAYPIHKRNAYIIELLQRLRPLRENKFRPQWIVLEEAQQFLTPEGNGITKMLQPMLKQGGWAFVSFRPDRLTPSLISELDHCLLARLSDEEAVRTVQQIVKTPSYEELANTPNGHIWLCGKRLVRLRSSGRRVPHIRHLYKYLDIPLPKEKRFYFHTDKGYLGKTAANLFEFKELIATLPIESLTYHQARGDFATWIRKTMDDELLAAHLDKFAHRTDLEGEALREAMLQRITSRYLELHNLR